MNLAITVLEAAHSDVRLTTCAAKLGLRRKALAWDLIAVWALVTFQKSTVLHRDVLAAMIGLPGQGEEVARVFRQVGLATRVDDETQLDLAPLGSMYSACTPAEMGAVRLGLEEIAQLPWAARSRFCGPN